MGKTYDKLDDKLIGFIKAQKMFFVATAPLSGEGHRYILKYYKKRMF